MTSVARALEMDETRGLMKAIVDAETEEILGATVLGIEGGEVMTVLQMAMMGHLKYSVLQDCGLCPSHPVRIAQQPLPPLRRRKITCSLSRSNLENKRVPHVRLRGISRERLWTQPATDRFY